MSSKHDIVDYLEAVTERREPEAAPAGRRRILIADDSRLTVYVLSSSLRHEGYDIVTATTGTAALEALTAPDAPRLAILDWNMPGLDGVEVCRRFRAVMGGSAYLILLTSNEDRASILEGLHAGADDYLTKPWDDEVLKARISVGWRILDLQGRLSDNVDRLEQSNARLTQLASIVEMSGDAIVGVGADGEVMSWNRGAEELLGYPAESAIGRPLSTLLGPEAEDAVQNIRDMIRHGGELTRFETVVQKDDGTPVHLSLSLSPMMDPAGHVAGAAAIGRDITAQRSVEAQLRQAQKMESIGQLAAGIAHEINTPVQYVGDNARFLLEAFGDLNGMLDTYRETVSGLDEAALPEGARDRIQEAVDRFDVDFLAVEIPRAIEQTLEGTGRIVRIVQSMKDFAHPGGAGKQAADLNKAIESTITVARNEWKYVADLATDLDPELPLVPCVVGDFNQVVLNLIVNAAHAIGDVTRRQGGKGKIEISTRRDGQSVVVAVSDTGTGIPEPVRARIFDPFFTTKEVGKGSGQGLAISYSIVERHGGSISFETEMGRGTTFSVRLPLEPKGLESE